MNPAHLRAVVTDLARVFRRDPGVRAMFIGGSLASGQADAHSDIDAYIIVADDAFQRVTRESGVRLGLAGNLLFLKRVDHGFPMDVFIYENGVRGELGIGKSTHFSHLHYGPYTVLFDRDGLLDGYAFPGLESQCQGPVWVLDQLEWAWREAVLARGYLARGDLWSAAQQLQDLRCRVASLLRWAHDPSHPAEPSWHRMGQLLGGPDQEAVRDSFFILEPRSMSRAHQCLCESLVALAATVSLDTAARARLDRLAALSQLQTASPNSREE